MKAAEKLAEFGAQFQSAELSDEVLHHAKRAVVDWYGALFSGAVTSPVVLLQKALEEELGRGDAHLPLGGHAPSRLAALINGAAAHAAEVDDSFRDAMYHPGAPTIAGALAAAQGSHASGAAFLRAVVIGYEVSTRIGVVLGRSHYRFWHSTGTVGTFGAAAAASAIYGLDKAAFAHALATAATFAAGLQQAFRMDSMSKPLHAGRAAEAGLLAAKLARQGVTGALDVLDGEAGLGKAMSNEADWANVADTLGRDFHITRLTFKNHIGCGHTFSAIDAALELRRKFELDFRNIERIRVSTYRPAIDIACYEAPQTENEARFSLKYVVAAALVFGSVRLAAYEAKQLANSDVRKLIDLIEVEVDPDLDSRFPRQRAAQVDIRVSDGRKLSHLQANRKGDPEEPLSDTELNEKMLELASPVLGSERAGNLLARLWSLQDVPDISSMDH
ncbi:MmgE/PrpD family protein [Noviherbaspirillum denitrificans]|uniref:2-methylcitrate dehydratase n=1 Tax=Noviherbaspirillum denitrificans TaxID=1968433 RepID=A0A254TG48_9BURK|nr:MmgE/PrpD family protein [Noviherbaspirillum denitrificans]OWW21147.1 2-methylcitrate dehydratase [Noviherbaspirillum denitrificans]